MLALLEEEIAGAQRECEAAEKENREDAALERDACLAPVGATWETLLREQAALDRSIDRKVRIILAMRKDYTRRCTGGACSEAGSVPSGPCRNLGIARSGK